MSRNNRQNRKTKASERHAAMRRRKTRALQEKAARERDPRFHELKGAAVAAAKEYLAEGKTPAEAKTLIRSELASMLHAKKKSDAAPQTTREIE